MSRCPFRANWGGVSIKPKWPPGPLERSLVLFFCVFDLAQELNIRKTRAVCFVAYGRL